MVIVSLESGLSFIFPSNEYFAIELFPQSLFMAIATVTAVGGSSAPSTSSGVLVPVLTIIGVGVSFRHDDINFELYWSMC